MFLIRCLFDDRPLLTARRPTDPDRCVGNDTMTLMPVSIG